MPINCEIINDKRMKVPSMLFVAIKESVLGKDYDLSVIITTPTHIKKLNTIYRNKKCPTDILSFPLSKKEGEIYLCLSEAKKEMKKFGEQLQMQNFQAKFSKNHVACAFPLLATLLINFS